MRIVCPTCAAAYDVPDGRVAPGQTVRCARCGSDWSPLPELTAPKLGVPGLAALKLAEPEPMLVAPAFIPEHQPEPAVAKLPIPEAVVSRSGISSLHPGRAGLAAAWVLSIAILVALATAAVARRADIMHAWPHSERLFALLGLPPGR